MDRIFRRLALLLALLALISACGSPARVGLQASGSGSPPALTDL